MGLIKLLVKLVQKVILFGSGLTIKATIDNVFDYGIYPVALASMGYVKGGLLMTVLASLINLSVIWAYDKSKTDWFSLELLKNIRDGKDGDINELPKVMRWLRWLLRWGDVPSFFVISTQFDPTIATLYLRRGAHQYDGLSWRDWKIFLTSTVIANLWWIGFWAFWAIWFNFFAHLPFVGPKLLWLQAEFDWVKSVVVNFFSPYVSPVVDPIVGLFRIWLEWLWSNLAIVAQYASGLIERWIAQLLAC